jgi:dienelactone hydrolase
MSKTPLYLIIAFTVRANIGAEAAPTYAGQWDKIRIYTHCWDRYGLTAADENYIASNSAIHVTEKRHNTQSYPSPGSEAAMRAAANSLYAKNPNAKYLMYLNAVVSYEDIFQTAAEHMASTPSDFFYSETSFSSWPGVWANDLSKVSCQNWWKGVVMTNINTSAMSGVFMDGLPKVATAGMLNEAHSIMDSLRSVGVLVIYNGYYTTGAGGILAGSDTLSHADGVYVESFFGGNCNTTDRRVQLMNELLAIPSNKYIVCHGGNDTGSTGTNAAAGGGLQFSLACYLIAANDFSFFKYGGYTADEDLGFRPAEYGFELGNPDPVGYPREIVGTKYTRYFESAKVVVNLDGTETSIDWNWQPASSGGGTMVRLVTIGNWATPSEWGNSTNNSITRVPTVGDNAVLNSNRNATVTSIISQTPDTITVNNQNTSTTSTLAMGNSGSLTATGSILIGVNDAVGILRLTNGASLSGSALTLGNTAALRPSTLHFVLGPSGFVNPINISGALTIRTGQKLIADASTYAGLPGVIALINYGTLSGSFNATNVTIIGLTNASIAADGDSLNLVIPDTRTDLQKVLDLGKLTNAPTLRADDFSAATTNVAAGQMKAVYFDALNYLGSPTRVYAWLGIPAGASASNKVPAVVLVHGGGGTAYTTWVQKWMDRGYAAISIAVEGQTDGTSAPTMNTGWHIHNMPGPVRVGIYGDSATTLVDQWMYHAVADTVLANSLLRSLPEVNAIKVGMMGISWGGVIVSTVMGLDNLFAFAVPVYGCGHLYDIPNQYGNALKSNPQYITLWDSSLRMSNAAMPALWLSWPNENNFSLDSQAATYLRAPGPRTVSLVPGMNHGHGPGWNRPESYDFADGIVTSGTNWCLQQSLSFSNGTARVVFKSTKPLTSATLTYTTGTGHTGGLTWPETNVTSLMQSPVGTWTVIANVPTNATAWFINVKATATSGPYSDVNLITTSDYQEITRVNFTPSNALSLTQSTTTNLSTNTVTTVVIGPTHVEIVGVQLAAQTHPGAFTLLNTLPSVITNANATALKIKFNNTVAGLSLGQMATANLVVSWEELDGSTNRVQLLVSVTMGLPLEYYNAWAAAYGLPGGTNSFLTDPEGDKIVNLLEYAWGGNPTNTLDHAILPFGHLGSKGQFQYIYRRRIDAATRGLSYELQGITNLTAGLWSTNAIIEVGSGPMGAEFESVTNELQLESRAFGRLKIGLGE